MWSYGAWILWMSSVGYLPFHAWEFGMKTLHDNAYVPPLIEHSNVLALCTWDTEGNQSWDLNIQLSAPSSLIFAMWWKHVARQLNRLIVENVSAVKNVTLLYGIIYNKNWKLFWYNLHFAGTWRIRNVCQAYVARRGCDGYKYFTICIWQVPTVCVLEMN